MSNESLDKAFERLDSLIKELRSLKPLSGVSAKTVALARWVANQPRLRFENDAAVLQWARSLAEEVTKEVSDDTTPK